MFKKFSAFFYVFCLLYSGICFSQNKVTIEWLSPTYYANPGDTGASLFFNGAVYEEPEVHLPKLTLNFPGISLKQFSFLSIQYEKIGDAEKELIPKTFDEDSIQISIRQGIKNKIPISLVSFIPIRYNKSSNAFEKIVSFTYTLTKNLIKQKSSLASNVRTAANSASVLANGNWYKLQLSSSPTSTGTDIYKIDYDFLKSMIGNQVDNVDPRQIKVFGNGGGMLPEANSAFKYDDLQENAILVVGEDDGKFDKGDYILFYGWGPDAWTKDSSKNLYRHVKNIYSDNSYYFLTIGDSPGQRINARNDTGSVVQTISQFPDYQFYERDDYNLLQSGKVWFGDKFETILSKDVSFNLSDIVSGSTSFLSMGLMAQSLVSSSFTVSINGTNKTVGIPASLSDYGTKGVEVTNDITVSSLSPGSNTLGTTFTYKKSTSSSIGFLDYCYANYTRNLNLNANRLIFRAAAKAGISQFAIQNATQDLIVWDVTNKIQPVQLPVTLNGSQGIFNSNTDSDREFIAFTGSQFNIPTLVGQVNNQNLHGLINGDIPDLIIITHETLKGAAIDLANFRSSTDKLKVVVATTDEIYNEYSSGAQDLVALRNFVKMFYDKASSSDSISYLLLFGAASYDYKNRVKNNNNLVPIYETPESLDNIRSQSSDDYCGFLDANEGNWEDPSVVSYLDIGIGRIPARSLPEAQAVVDKLKHYSSSPECLGKWRNKVCLVADNQDLTDPPFKHMDNAESLASVIAQNSPCMNINKLYMDAFPLISAPGGQISPQLKDAVLKQISQGALVTNYTGHGSEFIWAQEDILNMSDINMLTNKNNLSFFVTATCEFGRYDDPAKFSGALGLVLNGNGGAVGILSSTRPVYAYSNVTINQAFYSDAFKGRGNLMPRLGDIMKNTKNNSIVGYNNRNYAMLGDPSMRLAYPEQQAYITKFNNVSFSDSTSDTLSALDKITLTGEVRSNNQINSSFNGIMNVSIYDKPTTILTNASNFQVQSNVIFDGNASISKGKFRLSFIVSKDISYNFGTGKMSLYGQDTSFVMDAGGCSSEIIIGGSAKNAPIDTIPPTIKLFIGDQSFVSGGLASPNTKLIALISDSSGINISNSGIGHEIVGIINDSKDVVVMNDFYSSAQDDYKSGILSYPLNNLPPGKYTIQIKAWDTYNNSSTQTIDFVVADNSSFVVDRILAFPNPFSDNTTISFEHNRSGEDLMTEVQIYSLTGDLVKSTESKILSSPSRVTQINWDGRDDLGSKISNGMYICKLKVILTSDGSEQTRHIKLILLN